MEQTKKRKHSPNLCQFTLSDEAIMILNKFSDKYGTMKSEVINRALKLLAAQYHIKLIISYEKASFETTTTTTEPKTLKEKTVERHLTKYGAWSELTPEEDEEMEKIIASIRSHKKN